MKSWVSITIAGALVAIGLYYSNLWFVKCRADARTIKIQVNLRQLATTTRLYAEAHDGALPLDLETVMAWSDHLQPLRLTFSPGALKYHRLADRIDAVPPRAVLLSYVCPRGAFFTTYGAEGLEPIQRRTPLRKLGL